MWTMVWSGNGGGSVLVTRSDIVDMMRETPRHSYNVIFKRERYIVAIAGSELVRLVAPLGTTCDELAELGIEV